ncbi:MAG TPA: hypothetical protein VGH80_02570 [Xanthomonadaceae bacterium]|jgi:hypothetical protein
MTISIISLIVAVLAVFFGPLISLRIAKRQIAASSDLANAQIEAALVTSNKQIIAPMRQTWINNLRDLLAELTSSTLHYYLAGFEDRTDQEYQRLTLLESKIQMMLNANESDHQRLEQQIRALISSLQQSRKSVDDFPDLHGAVVSLSREILKREWDRVKKPISASAAGNDA